MKVFYWLLSIAIFISIHSCTFKNEEDTYGDYCDTSSVTFSAKIRPIMEQHCYNCHGSSNANTSGGGLEFQTYTNFKGYLDVSKDHFLSAINLQEINGVTASVMPKSSPKLSACEIRKLEIWIEDGYPDN